MKHIKKLRIDIDKNNFEVIPSVQYDSNTRFLHIQLLDGAVPLDITGCSVILSGIKQDGNPIFNSCNIINSKTGFIEAEVTEQMNAMAGDINCEIKIYDGNGVLTTKKFTINVTASHTSREIESTGEFKALTKAINEVQNIDNKFSDIYSHLEQMTYYCTPEMFLGTDAEKIEQCIDKSINDGCVALLPKKYNIDKVLSFKGNSKPLNLIITGSITSATGIFYFENFIGGKVEIRVEGGGNNSLSTYGVTFRDCHYMDILVEGRAYKGTLLKMGGNRTEPSSRVSKMVVKLSARDGCLRALEHGDYGSNLVQNAFGEYEYIIDFNSENGLLFQRSTDITIKHIENIFTDPTLTKNSCEFIDCTSVHLGTIALGGDCKYLLNLTNFIGSINKLFVISESSASASETRGVLVDGVNTVLNVDTIVGLRLKSIVDINNTSDKSIVNFKDITNRQFATNGVMIRKDGTNIVSPTTWQSYHLNQKSIEYGKFDLYTDNGALIRFKHSNSTNDAFRVGKTSDDSDFSVVSRNIDGITRTALTVRNSDGRVTLGNNREDSLVGFFGTSGRGRTSVGGKATDLESALTLLNNIRTALDGFGLIKE